MKKNSSAPPLPEMPPVESNPPSAGRKKVLIVDDHPLLRNGLINIINQQADLEVCGQAGTAAAGLMAAVQLHPDVAIVDISLQEGSGLDLVKDIHARQPALPILVLSMHREDIYGARAINAGASGYVMKSEPVEKLLEFLRKLLAGQMAMNDNVVRRLVGRTERLIGSASVSAAQWLSDRELEIFRAMGEGRSTRQIAAKLRIALSTVESHRASIKQKLKLNNATELVSAATRYLTEEART